MRLNIRGQLIGFAFFLILLVGGSISLYSIYQVRTEHLKRFKRSALESTKIIALTVTDALYQFKISTLRRELQATRIDQDIVSTYVLDSDGLVLSDGTAENLFRDQIPKDAFSEKVLQSHHWIHETEGNLLKIGGPVYLIEEHLGFLIVTYSLDRIRRDAYQTITNNIIITVLCFTMGAALAFFLAGKYSKPIQNLLLGTKKIAEGNLSFKIENESEDEIGQLANAFNKMTETLRETTVSKEFVDNIIYSMTDSLIVLDQKSMIQSINRATTGILGYDEQELTGMHFNTILLDEEKGKKPPLPKNGVEKLWNQGSVKGIEVTYFSKSGREIPVLLSASIIYDKNRKIQGIVCIAKDITQQKLAEEELKRHRDQLEVMVQERTFKLNREISDRKKIERELKKAHREMEKKVEERTADYKKAKEEAERANQSKNEFLANMSHELRTPMHHILSYSKSGINKFDKVEKERLLHYFTQTRTSGERLMILLNDLLDLSKLESGQMNYDMKSIDLAEMMKQIVAEFSQIALENEIYLRIEEADLPTIVTCDSQKIGQVIRNLLSNAMKYTPTNKSIVVSYDSQELPLANNITNINSVTGFKVKITDEGSGIPDNELETIFDKFIQSSMTKSNAGGTGLGLAICKEIIMAHQGKIWAENNPQCGATFSFVLPYQSESNHIILQSHRKDGANTS